MRLAVLEHQSHRTLVAGLVFVVICCVAILTGMFSKSVSMSLILIQNPKLGIYDTNTVAYAFDNSF